MSGLNRQLNHSPTVLRRHLANNLLQARAYPADEHLAPPFETPDEVVHDEVDDVPFMDVVHVDNISIFNTARKAEGPCIRRLKPGTFWPHSVIMPGNTVIMPGNTLIVGTVVPRAA